MSLYLISVIIFMLCIYIAITVNKIINNQERLNNARYEQVKKLQDDIVKLKSEIISIKQGCSK